MDKAEFEKVKSAIDMAIARILNKGTDDVFRPPIFSRSIESSILGENEDSFRKEAYNQTLKFLKSANLQDARIGSARRGLVAKDESTFREVAWLDPFDAVKYLALSLLTFDNIESKRISKQDNVIHSHRKSDLAEEIFDANFGYDSFRRRSSELSSERIGKWKIITDIANFFDRIGNHTLENHLLNIGIEPKYVALIREVLLFWAGDRRSFGIPVGSDASRILSEATLLQVDRKLNDSNIVFIRYVDDFRIFTETRFEALKAVELLTTLLAEEGLSLNSRKTSISKIVNPEEVAEIANLFQGGEHEAIDLEKKIEVQRLAQVSGKGSISKFYKEPGKDALKNIKKIGKGAILSEINICQEHEFESKLKLAVKFFVYVDHDVEILKLLLDRRLTAIFYIADALVKEAAKFSAEECDEIRRVLFDEMAWEHCAYPLQVPVLRLAAHDAFRETRYVRQIVDNHLQLDCMLFFREVVSLGYPCLDRARIRRLAIHVFGNVPEFVRRAIFFAVREHPSLSDDEKRPLLKNMRQHGDDWFIELM
ncbi:hypothetical protein GCM10009127_15840 [Alteraurantiacibacter aestuarii]|uniref:Reverse transcriptase domain-containing protein n=1 Tax=Alteraurantiacibacter aestuarii TaxID=650004 RepID=A0A844ZLE0_9SPHN|nr:RNA-directed DNA polymerase [Alteraurantiacibacter aestuarii]MXO87830.1 hypothetical protein [Alteraurantiacibacter aestuarii]